MITARSTRTVSTRNVSTAGTTNTTGPAGAGTVPRSLRADIRPSTVPGELASAAPPRRSGPTLVQVREGLWRVVDRTGAVLGHIEREAQDGADRYRARRLVMATRRIDLGAFWRMDDAADCFR